uniref:Uncharacterized protein n=1 Tax=Nelumbo nucifera TaxID=4432 RepID=A0A822Z131_NELNU|nr:TPA_asm: hypothetical protein HUJ06_009118 [Nelumbo nucifera]
MGNKTTYDRETKKLSSLFSIFSIFKCKKPHHRDDVGAEARNKGRLRRSDEDRGHWVGEPDVDEKATQFITKFYTTRISDPEWQIVKV